ncbi:hypothetical protein MPTK1_6g19930 [Marchantia polymorpha subsp. ruderalis]|uniref:Uncharacterized protein n=2 Tax=Marchantia polymorpha TaxID=3197 RepID=A0AAF6BTZ5_MARPO|nr:hypothetical protein MARPO_0045s0070 [Marchantia polymorpha]BBN15479.1 hypothetical protein Mp_6g19930 [Marchantia polymorpha subsp. ruderalis]|eukprot:PTQ39409.1 hypothetical protein MARPO_0045s0070 [Marchantia polymorpha]
MEDYFDRFVGSRLVSFKITDFTRTHLVLSLFDNQQTRDIRLACRTDLKCPWIDESPPELGHFATLLKKICDTTNGAEVELIETGNIRGHYDPDCGKKIWFAVMRLELRWGDYTIILKDLTASGSWPHDVPFRQGMYLIKD